MFKMRTLLLVALNAVALCKSSHFCPDGWVVSDYDNNIECILLGGVNEIVTNDDATFLCQFHGGWLVDMDGDHGPLKNTFIKSLISDADGSGGIGNAGMQYNSQWWIGAHVYGPHGDHNWGNWTWDHNGNEVEWYDWMRNEPNDWHQQNCLTFLKDQDIFGSGSYHWNDWDCNTLARYICERPPNQESSTTTKSTAVTTNAILTITVSTPTITTTTTATTTIHTATPMIPTTTTSGSNFETTTTVTSTFTTPTLTTTTTSVTTTTTDASAEYLYLSHNKVLHIPDFTQITCELNYPNVDLIFGVAGLVQNRGEDRLLVCGEGCHLLTENGWEPINQSFKRLLAAASGDGAGGWMVSGGMDAATNRFFKTTEIYKSDGSWEPGPDLPTEIHDHCQVEVGTQVFIIGGRADSVTSSLTYVLNENNWEEVTPMAEPREFHACAELMGKIYSIGGSNPAGTTVEIYDPDTSTWVYGPPLPLAVHYAQVINFQDTLYLVGGEDHTQVFYLSYPFDSWEAMDGVAVDEPNRVVFPAPLVSSQVLLGCIK